MGRKGISFTLTIVVAGVILLMTALSIITLGGSSLANFFNVIGGQQEQAVTQADVRQACQQRAQTIQQEYCSQYVQTAQYSGGEWQEVVVCGDSQPNRRAKTSTPGEGDTAYENTASQENCEWGGVSGYSQTVSIEGNTYNCVDQGYLSRSCPVQ